MNDSTGKTASSLAITEKRPHKPGGCVGIFFQLFDWNRRFAKKKLFPKKLLPPARAKEASRKFAGDEKLPKHRLIASENSGGFPNVMKNGACDNDANQKPGTQSPSLVARLMGLDSMPAAQQDKVKKASIFESNAKHELRPQKLQKTGPSERQPLSRFGTEALQFKSVLSRSRKQRPKLASPVKSPRNGRNASRLVDVAARILEPGLHARNRAKCALTYSSTVHHIPKDEVKLEETMAVSPDLSKSSNYHAAVARSLKGQSCKNCGSSVDDVDCGPSLEQQPLPFASSVSNYVNPCYQGLERSIPRPAISSIEQVQERVSERSQEQPLPDSIQARNNLRTHPEVVAKRKPINREDQIHWHWTGQQCKPQKDLPIAYKHKTYRQNPVPLGKDRVPPRPLHTNRVSSAGNAINETKDFVTLNQSPSRTRPRMPPKVDNCKYDAGRMACNKRDGSLSLVRKRRSINVNQQGESSGFGSSTFAKQRNVRYDGVTGMGIGLDAQSMNRTCSRSIKACPGDSNRTSGNKDSEVISFTFSSPMKLKAESGFSHSTKQEIPVVDKTDRKMSREASFPLSGDALSVLLEQKLKELTCQEEDELTTGGIQPKRTTAIILQELISALTAERPVSRDDLALGSNEEKVSRHRDHLLDTNLNYQVKDKTVGASHGYFRDGDHLSPGSVLDAPFSNDSCLSSSVDDNSAPNLHPDTMDCSCDGLQRLEIDTELSDSATSLRKERSGLQLVTNLLRQISEALYSIGLADTELKGSNLIHAEEVILYAELIFKSVSLQYPNGSNDFSICQFLIYELETLASALWSDFGDFLSVGDINDGNQVKRFLFDCVVEYLDARYSIYFESGFKAWQRLPHCTTPDELINGVVKEVRRWTRMAGKIPDDIIEREMSHSLGKWTDFEIGEYETGAEINRELLQILVDELVMDLYEGHLGSSPYNTAL